VKTITLQRDYATTRCTLGTLDVFGTVVQTLEDGAREHKVAGETRIPAGEYQLELRTEGGMHARYSARYSWHRGMIWLRRVPLFEWVYIHPGNTPADTLGCILVGLGRDPEGERIANSRAAYERIYTPIAQAIEGPLGCRIAVLD
jgi:hypothetical protein